MPLQCPMIMRLWKISSVLFVRTVKRRERRAPDAKLAVGYLLDELKNDITRETPASFEPSIDYVVTQIPRFPF